MQANFTNGGIPNPWRAGDYGQMRIADLRRQNLRRLIDRECKGIAAPLAKRLGIQPSYLSRLFNTGGPHGRNIGDALARQIETEFGLPDGWMDSYHSPAGTISPSVTITELPTVDEHGVSVIVTERWMYQHLGVADPQRTAILTASGDSMIDTIHDGDVLFVDRSHDAIRADAIYVLTINSDLWVRRVQRRVDGSLALIPDNARYEPYILGKDEHDVMTVLGRVIGLWRWQRL